MLSGTRPFFAAIRSGDLTGVRALGAAEPSLLRAHDPDNFGAVPLTVAVDGNDRAMVDLLLDLGADPNQGSDWWAGSFNPLDSASEELSRHLISRGATLTAHAAARLGWAGELRALLAADPEAVHARGGDGQTPLHFAATPEIAGILLDHGAAIDVTDIDHGSTPAQWLVGKQPRTAASLVSRGAKADPFLAACVGDVPLLQHLLAGEVDGVNTRISRQRFPVPPPAAGHIYLYTLGEGSTLLHVASCANQPAVISWLVGRGADPNARGGYDHATPLHTASWHDRPEAAIALLDAGADINARSGPMHHNEPLGWAIVSGAESVVRVLLDRGATVAPHHKKDAVSGAAGAFRRLNAHRAIEQWRRIAAIPALA